MSYNKKNWYRRARDIQAIYKKHSKNFEGGSTNEWIFENLIEPNYRICRSMFYEYLRAPAAAKLKEYEEQEKKQMTLF